VIESTFSQRQVSQQGAGLGPAAARADRPPPARRAGFVVNGSVVTGVPLPGDDPASGAHEPPRKRADVSPRIPPAPPQKRQRAVPAPPIYSEYSNLSRDGSEVAGREPIPQGPPLASPMRGVSRRPMLGSGSPDTSTESGSLFAGGASGARHPLRSSGEGGSMRSGQAFANMLGRVDSFRGSGSTHGPKRETKKMNPAALSPPSLKNTFYGEAGPGHADFEMLLRHVKSPMGMTTFRRRFKQTRVVGRGSFGTVHCVTDRLTGGQYAIKEQQSQIETVSELRRQVRELQAHKAAGWHPNVVRFHGCWVEDRRIFSQMELCGPSLGEVDDGRPLNAARCLQVYADISSALRHLHSRGIVHLDVKPENIYTVDGGPGLPAGHGPRGFKLGDFGSASAFPAVDGCGFEEGDARYLAPELLRDDWAHLDKADLWALGASLYEKHSGQPLPREGTAYRQLRNEEVFRLVDSLMFATKPLKAALRGLLDPDPEKRSWVDLATLDPPAPAAGLASPLAAAAAAAASPESQEDEIEADTPDRPGAPLPTLPTLPAPPRASPPPVAARTPAPKRPSMARNLSSATELLYEDADPISPDDVAGPIPLSPPGDHTLAARSLADAAAAVPPGLAARFLQLAGAGAGRALEEALRAVVAAMERTPGGSGKTRAGSGGAGKTIAHRGVGRETAGRGGKPFAALEDDDMTGPVGGAWPDAQGSDGKALETPSPFLMLAQQCDTGRGAPSDTARVLAMDVSTVDLDG